MNYGTIDDFIHIIKVGVTIMITLIIIGYAIYSIIVFYIDMKRQKKLLQISTMLKEKGYRHISYKERLKIDPEAYIMEDAYGGYINPLGTAFIGEEELVGLSLEHIDFMT